MPISDPPRLARSDTMPLVRERWIFLAVLSLVAMWNYADRIVMSVLLEPIKNEFQVSDANMGLLSGLAFSVSYALFGIPFARYSDRGDRRVIVTFAVTLWTSFAMCCGFAANFIQLAIARIGVGIGEAGAMPPAQSLIAEYFPSNERTKALGIFMASAMVGNVIAFAAGAHLAVAYGWRAAFIGVAAPGFLIALLAWAVLKEPRRSGKATFRQQPTEPLLTNLLVLAGKPSYVLVNCAMIMFYFVSMGATAWFPAYLNRVMNVQMAEIGSVFGPAFSVATLAGTILGGVTADRLAARDRRWLGWHPAITLIIAFPMFGVGLYSNNPVIFAIFACSGLFFLTAALPAMLSLLHCVCGSTRRAMAVAMLYFFANLLGLSLGPYITGSLSDHFSATAGAVGLRYALIGSILFLLPASFALLMAASRIERDAEV